MSLMLAKTRKEKAKLIGFDEKPVEIDVDINEFIQFDKLCLNDREIIPTDYITGKGTLIFFPLRILFSATSILVFF